MADPQESVEIKGPGGLMAKFTGQNAIAIVMALAVVFIGWMVFEHRVESKEQLQTLASEQQKSLNSVAEALNKNAEEQAVMNFILTLDQDQRQKLRLDMPESLRRRMRP